MYGGEVRIHGGLCRDVYVDACMCKGSNVLKQLCDMEGIYYRRRKQMRYRQRRVQGNSTAHTIDSDMGRSVSRCTALL